MNCIELNINNTTYRMRNKGSVEGFNPSTDFPILNKFLAGEKLPNGWIFEDLNGNHVNQSDFFDLLSEGLKSNKAGQISQFNFAFNNLEETIDDKIKKIIGNGSFVECMEEWNRDKYNEEYNVLYISSTVSGSTWYGINSERCTMITGNKFWRSDIKNRIIYEVYNDIKNAINAGDFNDETIKTINSLYYKYVNEGETDVFKQLSYLANNKINELTIAFFNPYSFKVKKEKITEANISEYIGTYTILKGDNGVKQIFKPSAISTDGLEGYLITIAPKVENGKPIKVNNKVQYHVISQESVTGVKGLNGKQFYKTFSVQGNTLYGKYWFNTKMQLIDEAKGNELFKKLMASEDKKSYYTKELDITINDIDEYCLEGDSVFTKSGVFIKNKDGQWVNYDGENVVYLDLEKNSQEQVFAISSNSDEIFDVVNKSITDKNNSLTEGKIRVFLYEEFEDQVEIRTDYSKEDTTFSVHATDEDIDGKYVPKIVVTIGKTMPSLKIFLTEIAHAKSFIDKLESNEFENVSLKNPDFKYKKYLSWRTKTTNKPEEERTPSETFFQSVYDSHDKIKDRLPNFDDVINKNNDSAKRHAVNDDEEVDELIDKLIDLGLYVHKCSI